MHPVIHIVRAVIVGVAVAGAPVAFADEGHGTIVITSPQEGAVVEGKNLELTYAQTKGGKADHAHVYLDGTYQKGFKGVFAEIPPGKHEIKVVAATDDHKALHTEAVVHIEVK